MAVLFTALCAALLMGCTTPSPLSAYEGRYRYEDAADLIIAVRPDDEAVFAIINGARYPLRPLRPDVFVNSIGQEVHFVRDESERVIGYRVRNAERLEDNPLMPLIDASVRVPDNGWHARPAGALTRFAYIAPPQLLDGLDVRALSEVDALRAGLSEMAQAIFDEEFEEVHSVLVYRNDALVFEQYFYEYGRDTPHQMRSATKTLMALVAGAAADRGLLSLDAPVLPFFPEYVDLANVDARKRDMTVRDLLTMQSGLACNDWDRNSPGNETRMGQTDDWARFILDLPMAADPGTIGSYCSGNVVLVGRIIEKVTHRPLREFADEVLFAPLGITDYAWDFRPDRSNTENFVQAWLRPRDMIKIGVMILNDGAWRGRQIVSADWVNELRGAHSVLDETPYGYFWWGRYINTPHGRFETPQATGNGGQKIIVLEAHNAVIVFTGGNYNADSHTNDLLARYVIPALTQ